MKKLYISILLSSIVPLMALGAEPDLAKAKSNCTDVPSLSGPLGPNRSQGDIGWCYANTAADLITYHFRTELKGARASGAYIALAYSNHYDSGGLAPIAIMKAQFTGFCLMSKEEEVLKCSVNTHYRFLKRFLS